MNSNQEILKLVKSASLSPKERNLWETILKTIGKEDSGNILRFIKSIPNGLRVITDNLTAKTAAILSGDTKMLLDVMKDEAKLLNN